MILLIWLKQPEWTLKWRTLRVLTGPRLIEIRQHSLAAQTYLAVDLIREAIDTFIMAEEWNKAKKVAREFEPG